VYNKHFALQNVIKIEQSETNGDRRISPFTEIQHTKLDKQCI